MTGFWIIGAAVFLAALLGGLYLRNRQARTQRPGTGGGRTEQPDGPNDEVNDATR